MNPSADVKARTAKRILIAASSTLLLGTASCSSPATAPYVGGDDGLIILLVILGALVLLGAVPLAVAGVVVGVTSGAGRVSAALLGGGLLLIGVFFAISRSYDTMVAYGYAMGGAAVLSAGALVAALVVRRGAPR